jgi:nitroreductase
MMSIMDALRERRSVRDYKSEAVPRRTIETLIGAATLAPSAMNEQPWHFTVVQDRALLDTISDRAKAYMLSSGGPLPERLRSMLQERAFHIFHHAPALIVISAPQTMPWAVEDCALAAENLMLAAAGEGLGTCWIGFAQSLLATDAGASLLGLPPGFRCVAPIVVGVPAAIPPPVARRPAAIHWIG